MLQLAKKLSARGARGERERRVGGERRPNEKLAPPSLSATPLQSVMGRHVDTSTRLFVVNVVDARLDSVNARGCGCRSGLVGITGWVAGASWSWWSCDSSTSSSDCSCRQMRLLLRGDGRGRDESLRAPVSGPNSDIHFIARMYIHGKMRNIFAFRGSAPVGSSSSSFFSSSSSSSSVIYITSFCQFFCAVPAALAKAKPVRIVAILDRWRGCIVCLPTLCICRMLMNDAAASTACCAVRPIV